MVIFIIRVFSIILVDLALLSGQRKAELCLVQKSLSTLKNMMPFQQ